MPARPDFAPAASQLDPAARCSTPVTTATELAPTRRNPADEREAGEPFRRDETPRADASEAGQRPAFGADSLAWGMLVMLALTVVQRGVGFFRGMWFCRLLDDHDLGRWTMAFGFITLITPVLLLGIPGLLPRYVEHYRRRGHLKSFLRRIVLTTACCGGLAVVAMTLFPSPFGWLIFLQPDDVTVVHAVAMAMVAMIIFNFVNDLNGSLRQVRVVSRMQFLHGVGFTIGGIAWLSAGGGLVGLIATFAAFTLLATAPGWWSLRRGWGGVATSDQPLPAAAMWRRLLPYAAALWMMNLLGNVFDLADRYMILHLAPGDGLTGQSAVGQAHSGRMVPELLLSLATMIGGILLPYLSADWEAGRPDAVQSRLRQTLLALSACFTLGGAMVLWLAPWLFSTLLQGRYESGLAVMPLALVFCSWAALVTIGQNYVWVVERGNQVALALAAGLVVNLGLNAVLIPRWGLTGAMTATLIAHGVVMVGVWLAMIRCGYGIDRTALYVGLLPATLLAGPVVAAACVAATMLASEHARTWIGEAIDLLRVRATASERLG